MSVLAEELTAQWRERIQAEGPEHVAGAALMRVLFTCPPFPKAAVPVKPGEDPPGLSCCSAQFLAQAGPEQTVAGKWGTRVTVTKCSTWSPAPVRVL